MAMSRVDCDKPSERGARAPLLPNGSDAWNMVPALPQRSPPRAQLDVPQARTRLFLKHSDPVVPLHEVNVLVAIARERGLPSAAILADAQIAPEMLDNPDARISLQQLDRIVANALRAIEDPGLGIECGKRMHVGRLGTLGTAMMCQLDLGSALAVAMQFHRLVWPAWDMELVRDEQRAVLRAKPVLHIEHLGFASEVLLACLHSVTSFLLRRPMQYRELHFQTPVPNHVQRYRELCSAPIVFDREITEFIFDAALLEQPLELADALTAHAAKLHCAASISGGMVRAGLVEQIRAILSASRPRTPQLSEVARRFATSPRQLRRELQALGTSYQRLLDQVRHERAVECLRGSTMTIEALANEVGFHDARSFRRRFKYWTGRTPVEYRREHLANLPRSELNPSSRR